MKQAMIQLETLSCPSCLQKIEKAVKNVQGVDSNSVKVLFNASKVKARFDENQASLEAVKQAIEAVGYEVLKSKVI